MSSQFISPVQRFYDENGNVASGFSLYTYESNTYTPKTTYTDSTEGTANANPIVLNSKGEAVIWLDDTGPYRLQLRDTEGAILWTIDQVTGAGGVLTNLKQASDDLDMDGNSIVTNSNKNLTINAGDVGLVNIKNAELLTNWDTNGNDILISDGFSLVDNATSSTVFSIDVSSNLGNYFTLSNAAAGNGPTISASGNDTDIGITFTPKGTGVLSLTNLEFETGKGFIDSSATSEFVWKFSAESSAVNYLKFSNSAAGNPVKIEALGDDSNIGIHFGSGAGSGMLSVVGTTDYENNISSSNDLPNVAFWNNNVPNYQCIAAVQGDSATPTATGHNIASLDDDGTGEYGLNFSSAISSASFGLITMENGNNGYSTNFESLGTSSAELEIYDAGANAHVDDDLWVIVIAN